MQLVIEVTRKCNLSCSHCLRGCAENLDINNSYITTMLEAINKLQVSYEVTFSGGEPMLNLKAIEHYITECKRLNISHSSFYISTNGISNNDEQFIILLLKLYSMSYIKELCAVDISNDEFHDEVNQDLYEESLLSGLSFASKKFTENYQEIKYLINQGNYQSNFNTGRSLTPVKIENFENIHNFLEETHIYLNAKGNVISGCDWSYNNQDNNKDIFISTVNNFENFINKHATYPLLEIA